MTQICRSQTVAKPVVINCKVTPNKCKSVILSQKVYIEQLEESNVTLQAGKTNAENIASTEKARADAADVAYDKLLKATETQDKASQDLKDANKALLDAIKLKDTEIAMQTKRTDTAETKLSAQKKTTAKVVAVAVVEGILLWFRF